MAKIVAMMPGGRRKTFPINQPTLTAGRSETCDIPLPTEGRASRQHMQVNIIAGVITVEDLNSANGTWFEGQKIARRTINDRDILTIGETRLQFLFDDNAKPDPPKAKKVRSLGTIDRDVVVEFSGGNFNEVEEPVPYVEVLDGEETRGLKVSIRVPLTVGRGSTCDLIIEGKKVSNTHTRFETLGDESWVSDLESTNGTFVNRRKLEPMQPVRIKHGDIIEVGEYRLSFKVPHEIRVEQAQAESTSVRSDLDRGYIARHTLRFVAGPRKGERVQMTERLTIGRHSYNNLNLLGEKVSNYHAEIVVAGQHFLLRDLKSTNGSYVGGRTVRPGKDRRLSHGDLISIGEHVMVFEEAGVDFDLDAAIARVRARANAKVGFAVMQGVAVVAFAIAVVFFLSEMVLRQINTSRRNTSVATPGVPMASPIEALSFEFDPNRIQSVPGWNCEIAGGQCEVLFDKPGEESELTDVKGGKWALRTRPNGAATRITLRTEGALSSELFARVKGQALDLSVQVRPDRFQGIAGIRVVWYGRDFSTKGTPVTVAWTTSESLPDKQWTEIAGTIDMPASVTGYGIELFAYGTSRTIWWDEVVVASASAGSRATSLALPRAHDKLLASFVGPARVRVLAGNPLIPAIERAELVVLSSSVVNGNSGGVVVRQAASSAGPMTIYGSGDNVRVRYQFSTADSRGEFHGDLRVAREADNYTISYVSTGDPPPGGETTALALQFGAGPRNEPWRLEFFNSDRDVITPEADWSGVISDVAELVWGAPDDRNEVGVLFSTGPGTVIVRAAHDGVPATCYVLLDGAGAGKKSPTLVLAAWSQMRKAAADAMFKQASDYERDPPYSGDALLLFRAARSRYDGFLDYGARLAAPITRLESWMNRILDEVRSNGRVAVEARLGSPHEASMAMEYVRAGLKACDEFRRYFRAMTDELREVDGWRDQLRSVQRAAEQVISGANVQQRREIARKIVERAKIHAGIDSNWTGGGPSGVPVLRATSIKSSLTAHLLASMVVSSYPDITDEARRGSLIVQAIDAYWAAEDKSDRGPARSAIRSCDTEMARADADVARAHRMVEEALASYPKSPHRIDLLARLYFTDALLADKQAKAESDATKKAQWQKAANDAFNQAITILPAPADDPTANDERQKYRLQVELKKRTLGY